MTSRTQKSDRNDEQATMTPQAGGGSVPVPDPTALTTANLRREIDALKELFEIRIEATEKVINAQQAAWVTRESSLSGAAHSQRELLMAEIEKSRAVTNEVFQRIDVQFIERDKRTEQLALASSTAIAAALQAAKEAVGAQNNSNSIAIAKSESSTLESLRQLRELFLSENKATNDKVDDLKTRLDKGEGGSAGRMQGLSSVGGMLVGGAVIIGVIISAVALILTISARTAVH
jgi:hypothetical protein